MENQNLMFIYGTLRRGGRAHHLMASAEFLSYGTIKGRLVHVDQYPGYIRGFEDHVKGELYRVNDRLIEELNRYEGCYESPAHYTREPVDVLLDDGETVVANVYVFQLVSSDQEKIENGDWLEWLADRKA